jgi:type III pantothenate kinase
MSMVAVDIGNSRIKLGWFDARGDFATKKLDCLPQPRSVVALATADWNEVALTTWSAEIPPSTPWWIASVNRPATARLMNWTDGRFPARQLTHGDLPITADVEHPDRVGIDRLAGAVAANRLRDPQRPAIVIGVGTAITVDFITADGVFRGGAIMPGIAMSARALDEFTDLLPRSPLEELSVAPPALGTSTLSAIHSGLYWGTIGAMRELVARISQQAGNQSAPPELFLTGGAAASVAAQLDSAARYVEFLVLAGIALAK